MDDSVYKTGHIWPVLYIRQVIYDSTIGGWQCIYKTGHIWQYVDESIYTLIWQHVDDSTYIYDIR